MSSVLFGVSCDKYEAAIERAACHHRASMADFKLGIERCGSMAAAMDWSLETTLEELGKLYDIGYGEPESVIIGKKKCLPKSAGMEIYRRICEERGWDM